MTKTTIKGDLILTKDTAFKEDLFVEGNINGWYDLKVSGNISADDIHFHDYEDIWFGVDVCATWCLESYRLEDEV